MINVDFEKKNWAGVEGEGESRFFQKVEIILRKLKIFRAL